jgi:hypothetical protein
VVFVSTTLATAFLFYKSTKQSVISLAILMGWLVLQSAIAVSGFYTVTDTMPPRFALAIIPPLSLIVGMFATRRGRAFMDSLSPDWLTLLHVVRIPVEMVLYWLFVQGTVPQLMTFEGSNLDILSGLTAPVVFVIGYRLPYLKPWLILIWNFCCLGLLCNVVYHGILSVPGPLQRFSFEQPNIALTHFPYLWLPCLIVPLVLFSHLVVVRRLLKNRLRST